MKKLLVSITIIGTLLLSGCTNDAEKTHTKPYQNKFLPTIKKDAIPIDLAIAKEKNKKLAGASQRSYGYAHLKERAVFFAFLQTNMNRNLSYMDSVWDQITQYCDGNQTCMIPDRNITFTYTEALYKNDLELIKIYEEKTHDSNAFSDFSQHAIKMLGTKIPLIGMKLIISDNTEYKYTLTSVVPYLKEMTIENETITTRWSETHDKYMTRNDYENNEYTQFTYQDKDDVITSTFESNLNWQAVEILTFTEKAGEYLFLEEILNDRHYSASGKLNKHGGEITYTNSEGLFQYEAFDAYGTVTSTVDCIDSKDKDTANITDNDSVCELNSPKLIKEIVTKSIYTLSIPFYNIENIASTEIHSMVKFENNNTMTAFVNCSFFSAAYQINDHGISFSNIARKRMDDTRCIDTYPEDFFEEYLNKGHSFGNSADEEYTHSAAYNTAFGMWPNFDTIDRNDFNGTKFFEERNASRFIDSSLMSSLYNVQSATEIFDNDNYQYFLLSFDPIVTISDEGKMSIEILDANFTADIVIADPLHIAFNNIIRTNKENVTYPQDEESNCSNESGEDECLDDPTVTNHYSDRNFADIVETFLGQTIQVGHDGAGHSTITFSGKRLRFVGLVANQ